MLLREPHHLPRQPTRSTLDSSAPGTSIYTSRAPNRPGLWRPPGRGFGALDLGTRDSTPANRTAPSSTPAKGARGGAQDPRVRRRHLPPPRRFPSFRGASHLSIFRCQLANAPGLLGLLGPPPGALEPLPLARGGPPRGGSVPSEPTPTARPISLAHHASHRRPQAHAESPAVRLYRPTATSRRHHRSARRPPTTHHAPVKVKQAQAHVPAQSLPPCHAIDHIHIGRRGPLPHGLTDPRWPRMVRANVPRSQLGSQGHDHAHKVGHRRPAGRVLPSPPSLPTGEDRASTVPQARRGPGAPLGHPVPGITTPQATQGPGRATHHRPSPPFPSNTVNWQRAGHIGIAPPGTQALRLTLSGQGPRPAHPANWRQVLDVERRPSSTGDARGRSLGVGPPPSARRCRGTLMGRCVLHKSSQGSG